MSCPPIRRAVLRLLMVCSSMGVFTSPVAAEPKGAEQETPERQPATNSPTRQAKLEEGLAKMLSGATLEGSFTRTGAGADPTRLSREKYTLGEVKKAAGDVWQIPARIQYGENDATLPIMLPIRWAGDTPVVTVDELQLPGFGAVSARVMFFDGHYAGYWKHGDHSGHLFGVIHPAGEISQPSTKPRDKSDSR